MDQSQKEGRVFSISMAVVFLGLIGVVLVRQLPLTPTRPAAAPQFEQPLLTGEVPARLWQDPFAAVSRDIAKRAESLPAQVLGTIEPAPPGQPQSTDGSRPSAVEQTGVTPRLRLIVNSTPSRQFPPRGGRLLDQIRAHTTGSGKLIVLAGMLFGGPYEELSEVRRQWRYAIVSALAESGYVPENSETIRYLRQGEPPDTEVIPYEWFVSGAPLETAPPVLLLWLNDDKFAAGPEQPLLRLLNTVSKITGISPRPSPTPEGTQSGANRSGDQQSVEPPRPGRAPDLEVKVLGPAGTTTLVRMVTELTGLAERGRAEPRAASPGETGPNCVTARCYTEKLRALGGLEIYSATATAEDCALLGMLPGCHRTVAEVFSEFNERAGQGETLLKLTRTINTDGAVAASLAQELILRGALSRAGRSHVVLISEWDTAYGRALPNVMQQQFESVFGKENIAVTRFSYLRGIDGRIPNGPSDNRDNRPVKDDGSAEFEKERPVGTARYDYLRRLVDTIKGLNDTESGRDKVLAIGVLGSDVYDKQLILQALRPVFPNVYFFTTDLDARLLHPTDFRWNRNLIIGSGYGLALGRKYQGKIPPFRSNYQTALFLSGLMALEYRLQLPACLKPRIFEVGRDGAFDLSASALSPVCAEPPGSSAAADSLYPASPSLFPSPRIWWQAAGLLLAALFFVYYTSSAVKNSVRDVLSRSTYPKLLLLASAGGIILAVYLFVHFIGGALRYEPFALFSGISAWPGILLRVSAFLLSALFIAISFTSLERSRRHLNSKIHAVLPRNQASEGVPKGTQAEASPLRFGEISVYKWRRDGASGITYGEQIWSEYSERGRTVWRLLRITPPMTVYLAVFSWIFLTSDYHLPVRGETAPVYTIAISFAAFFSISLLTFIIEDASRLCRRFIQLLSRPHVHWTSETKHAFMEMPDESVPRDEWVSLRLISERANKVARLIVYPFVVLFVLIISRLSYFDSWNTPIGIAFIYLTLATYAFINVFILHRSAQHAREKAIDSLEEKLIRSYQEDDRTEEYKALIERIRDLHEGAFRPLAEQPVVKALLLPFGGGAGLLLLDYLDVLK